VKDRDKWRFRTIKVADPKELGGRRG